MSIETHKTNAASRSCGEPLTVQWVGMPVIKCGGRAGLCSRCLKVKLRRQAQR